MSDNEKRMLKEQKRLERENKLHASYQKIANGNKQRLLTFICYIVVIFVVIASSLISLGFGFGEDYDWGAFAFKLALGLMISILGMVLSLKDGELANDNRKWGAYHEAKVRYKSARKKIGDTESFRQWADELYLKEKQSFIDSQLAMSNLHKFTYLYLTYPELEKLKTEPLICSYNKEDSQVAIEEPFPQITPYQFEVIRKYKDGRFTFNKVEYTQFMSGEGVSGYKLEADKGQEQQARKVKSITFRIVLFILTSFIFASALVDKAQGEAGQIAFDLIGRFLNLFASMFFGYSLATQEAKENTISLDYKSDMIEQFSVELELGTFKPRNIDEETLNKIRNLKKTSETPHEASEKQLDKEISLESTNEPETSDFQEFEVDEETYKKLLNEQSNKK